jgi:hypothetical protein
MDTRWIQIPEVEELECSRIATPEQVVSEQRSSCSMKTPQTTKLWRVCCSSSTKMSSHLVTAAQGLAVVLTLWTLINIRICRPCREAAAAVREAARREAEDRLLRER